MTTTRTCRGCENDLPADANSSLRYCTPECRRAVENAARRAARASKREPDDIGLPEGRWVPNGRGIVVRVGADGLRYRGKEDAA